MRRSGLARRARRVVPAVQRSHGHPRRSSVARASERLPQPAPYRAVRVSSYLSEAPAPRGRHLTHDRLRSLSAVRPNDSYGDRGVARGRPATAGSAFGFSGVSGVVLNGHEAARVRPIRQRASSRPRCWRSGRAVACIPASVRQAGGLNVIVPRWRSATVGASAAFLAGAAVCWRPLGGRLLAAIS